MRRIGRKRSARLGLAAITLAAVATIEKVHAEGSERLGAVQSREEEFMEPDEEAVGHNGDEGRDKDKPDGDHEKTQRTTAAEICGALGKDGEKIVGGCQARPGAWPSFVELSMGCGGVLISEGWVLTAAHCVVNEPDPEHGCPKVTIQDWRPGDVTVFEGSSVRGKGKQIAVAEIVRHPGYTGVCGSLRMHHDIALLRLSRPAQSPIVSLEGREIRALRQAAPTRNATVIGFGILGENGPLAESLMQVDVPLIDAEKCKKQLDPYGWGIDYAKQICAGLPQGGKDSCQGDSGGPLFLRDRLGQPYVAGIVSGGEGCARKELPGVYTLVAGHEDWIKKYVREAVFHSPAGTTVIAPALEEFVGPSTQPSNVGGVTVDIAGGPNVRIGNPIVVRVTSSITGFLIVLNRDESGRTIQLFPNKFSSQISGREKQIIRAGETIKIPEADQPFVLRATPPAAQNTIIAIVAPDNAQIDDLVGGKGLEEIADAEDLIAKLKERSDQADRGRSVEVVGGSNRARAVGTRSFNIVK